jgi:hypothetical protein
MDDSVHPAIKLSETYDSDSYLKRLLLQCYMDDPVHSTIELLNGT